MKCQQQYNGIILKCKCNVHVTVSNDVHKIEYKNDQVHSENEVQYKKINNNTNSDK